MYAHNASTLLGSKRRSIYYPPTGTGRDTYIMIDNGGTNSKYTCQGVPELGNYMKFGPINRQFKPVSSTKFQKYASEGRDKFCKAIQYACRFLKYHYEQKGDTQTSKKLESLFGKFNFILGAMRDARKLFRLFKTVN